MNRSGFRFLAAMLLGLVLSATAVAQTTSTISGLVKDETSAVIPGVELTIRNTETGRIRTVVTDAAGRYSAPLLALGTYDVSARLEGFQTVVRQGVEAALGRDTVVNITMQIGEISEEVVVSGFAVRVETGSSSVSNLVEKEQIDDLPLNGRSFGDLVALDSSVTSFNNALSSAGVGTAFGGTGVRLVVAGLRPELGNILVDGTDAIDAFGNAPGSAAGVLLGVDTIREFEVLSSNYSAEFGRAAGGTINTATRSGSNEFHGTAFEYLRNDNLDARNFFDLDQPEFKRNQFGFTLGGPIAKDRVFFFVGAEFLRDQTGLTLRPKTITEQARLGNLPAAAGGPVDVDPRSARFFDLFPLPNGRDFGDGTGEYIFSADQPTDEDFVVAKVDFTINEQTSAFVRYSFDDAETLFPPIGLPPNRAGRNSRQQLATVAWSATLTPRLLSDSRVGYNRSLQVVPEEPLPGIRPDLSFFLGDDRGVGCINVLGVVITGCLGGLGKTVPNEYQFNQDIVYSAGDHSLKFGFVFKRFQYNDSRVFQEGGTYNFEGLRNFLDGVVVSFVGDLPDSDYHTYQRFSVLGSYIQDDWKVHPDLTLNLGLRWEMMTTPYNDSGPVENFIDPFTEAEPAVVSDKPIQNPGRKNFAPRLGFAWDPFGNGRTAVRGGFGLFFQQLNEANLNFVFRLSQNRTHTLIIGGPPASSPTNFPNVPQEAFTGRSIVFPLQYDAKMPYTAQWNFNIQRELASGLVAQVAYLGNRGIHLARPTEINFRRRVVTPDGVPFFPAGPPMRENPNFTSINMRDFGGDSYYHGVSASLRKRFSDGYSFQVSYTLSKTIDNTPPILRDNENSPTILFDYQNPNLDRSLSGFDVRENFVANFSAELPFGSGKRYGANASGFAGKFLEGWQVNGIVTLASGNPFTVVNSFDQARTAAIGPFRHDRPDLAPGADNNPVLGSPDLWFDVNAFQLEQAGFLGNLGRNTLDGPGLSNVDLSLFKTTSVSEDVGLQFRFEVFNLFNRANFSTPESNNRTAFTGEGIVNGSAGRLTSTVTTSRQIQFGLRLTF